MDGVPLDGRWLANAIREGGAKESYSFTLVAAPEFDGRPDGSPAAEDERRLVDLSNIYALKTWKVADARETFGRQTSQAGELDGSCLSECSQSSAHRGAGGLPASGASKTSLSLAAYPNPHASYGIRASGT